MKYILSILILILILLTSPGKALAVNCTSTPASGNYSVTEVCTFPNTIDGVDTGTSTTNTAILTISTGGSLTVSNGQTIAIGSITLTAGSITIIDGGFIKPNTPIFVLNSDSDGDGWLSAFTFYTTAADGRVRRNTIKSSTEVDCDDAISNTDNNCCYDEYGVSIPC